MKLILTAAVLTSMVSAETWQDYLERKNIPSSGNEQWVSLDNGVEFQPSENSDSQIQYIRRLWGVNREDDPLFVDGTETYYDDYAQAWRLLGFYTDCNHCEDGGSDAYCAAQGEETICQRFLLWAAYVDVNYSGNGFNEYMYYDRKTKTWSDYACVDGERCVKMNCHESNSHWKLLGIFKEPNYNTFLTQIYNYQGSCTWSSETSSSFNSALNFIPEGCTQADNGLYYDIKPKAGGQASITLYNDAYCIDEFRGKNATLKSTFVEMATDDDAAQKEVTVFLDDKSWSEALGDFKICQPCRISDITYALSGGNEQNSNCQAAGTNQCKMFAGSTYMYTASYRDLLTAEEQGTLSSFQVGGVKYGKTEAQVNNKWQRNFLSALFMITAFFVFISSLNHCQNETNDSDASRPLMDDEAENGNRRRNRRHRSG